MVLEKVWFCKGWTMSNGKKCNNCYFLLAWTVLYTQSHLWCVLQIWLNTSICSRSLSVPLAFKGELLSVWMLIFLWDSKTKHMDLSLLNIWTVSLIFSLTHSTACTQRICESSPKYYSQFLTFHEKNLCIPKTTTTTTAMWHSSDFTFHSKALLTVNQIRWESLTSVLQWY